ncbi:MAG: hypothetical protein WC432_02970 [Candidatus Omnitrophota bacterium]|jgi:Spy/CpxP family protein refolding chaperone
MKKLIIFSFLSVIFFSAFPVFAQEDESPDVDLVLTDMQTQLTLTPQQSAAVKPILEKYAAKRRQTKRNLYYQGVNDSGATVKALEGIRQEEEGELSRILTPEQLKKWNDKQRVSNFLNKDNTGDNRWQSKGSGGMGLGMDF